MSLDAQLLRSSFDTVITREPELARRFYDTLFARHPELRSLLGRNTRKEQEAMLAQALIAVLDHLEDAAWLRDTLRTLGAKHDGYGVTAEMYTWVGNCLIATLQEVCGESWSPALEGAWSAAYTAIADTMKEGALSARAS